MTEFDLAGAVDAASSGTRSNWYGVQGPGLTEQHKGPTIVSATVGRAAQRRCASSPTRSSSAFSIQPSGPVGAPTPPGPEIPLCEERDPMSKVTQLASGHITAGDRLSIELLKPTTTPSVVLLKWLRQPRPSAADQGFRR